MSIDEVMALAQKYAFTPADYTDQKSPFAAQERARSALRAAIESCIAQAVAERDAEVQRLRDLLSESAELCAHIDAALAPREEGGS